MTNRSTFARVFVLASAGALAAGVAQACTVCPDFASAAEQLAKSDAVFRARVLKVERLDGGRSATTFVVAEALKGKLPRQVRMIHTTLGAGECGIAFRRGDTVVLSAYRTEAGWSTGACHKLQFTWREFRQAGRARSAASW